MSDELDLATVQSGQSGVVAGPRRTALAQIADAALDTRFFLCGKRLKLRRAARHTPPQSVIVGTVYRPEHAEVLGRAAGELLASHHDVRLVMGAMDEPAIDLEDFTVEQLLAGGKFENLNEILPRSDLEHADCVIAMDDDVELPPGFLDEFLFLANRFDLTLAQPALTRTSHCAWKVCRRQGGSVARLTRFVEIGPLTAFRGDAIRELLPFPDVSMGWGLDLHWGAIARERGWRVGVVDATPIRHALSPTAAGYDREEAERETIEFLSARPHLTREEALETLERYTSW